MELSGLILWNT